MGPYVDDRLLGLGHVRDDAVRDDEEHKVLGAVLHRRRVPAAQQHTPSRVEVRNAVRHNMCLYKGLNEARVPAGHSHILQKQSMTRYLSNIQCSLADTASALRVRTFSLLIC